MKIKSFVVKMSSNNIECNSSDEDEDVNNWEKEANGIIKDVNKHVKEILISRKFQSTDSDIFLNITILEGTKMCVRVSCEGFEIVGNEYDSNSLESSEDYFSNIYETPYALLSNISNKYVESFGNDLVNALNLIVE